MADRIATSDDTVAGGAPAGEALRSVRKARRELLAVLTPLVVAAVAAVVTAGIFMEDGGRLTFFAITTAATAALPAVGMLALFYTLSHGSTQNTKLHVPLAVLFGITAVDFALSWLLLALVGSGSASVFPLGVVLVAQIAAVFPSILLGFFLLSMRGKRHDMLFGEASLSLRSRRRLRAAAWMAVAGIAIALSLVVTIPLAVVEVAVLRDSVPLPSPNEPVSQAYYLAAELAGWAESRTRFALIMSLRLTPAWLMILLLPLALLAGDTYQHRRRRAGLGPDRHLARASRVILIILAGAGVLGLIAVPTLNMFLRIDQQVSIQDFTLGPLLDWFGFD